MRFTFILYVLTCVTSFQCSIPVVRFAGKQVRDHRVDHELDALQGAREDEQDVRQQETKQTEIDCAEVKLAGCIVSVIDSPGFI